MIRSRLGLKALVLSGLVLGLMAFAGGTAQATVGAKWLVNGKVVDPATLKVHLEIELENNTAELEFKTAGGTSVKILCTSAEFDPNPLLLADGTISLAAINFKGCVVSLNGTASKNCKPHSAGKGEESKEILTLVGEGLLVLDNGEHLVKITPETEVEEGVFKLSKHFVTIEMGELCAIGESVNVESTELGEGLWIKDGGGNVGALEEKVTHLIVEASVPLHKLLALGQPALILGSANVRLTGDHAGLSWKGDWT